jgi:ABC-type dipeptide/oligopeptide/nickel transport system permease subunit
VALAVLALAAFVAPILTPYSPFEVRLTDQFLPPSLSYPLGTDHLGRDILTRVIYGTRVSLVAGFGAASLAALIGIPLGLLAAYFGGWASSSLMRFMDFLLALPAIVLALTIVAVLQERGLFQIILAVTAVAVPVFVRVTRASTLVIRSQEYVEASDALGASDAHIVFRVILPNVVGPLIAVYSVTVASAVLIEGGLSFLGLGLPPPNPSWGLMLNEGRSHLAEAPWYGIAPGIALAVTVLALDSVSRAMHAASGVESMKKVA